MTRRTDQLGGSIPRRAVVGAAILAGLLATAGLLAACASPTPTPSSPPSPPNPKEVVAAITEGGLRDRLDALAGVAAGSIGFRAVGAAGFEAASDLVAAELRAAGWTVTEDAFTTSSFADPGGSNLVAGGRTFGVGDIAPLIFAPAGEVSGPVVAIDWDPDASEPTGKGCAASDYGDLPEGAIVLVRPGPCYRRDQVLAAQQAGAGAFVVGYPWTANGEVLRPTLIEPAGLEIPAAAASRPAGDALAAAAATGSTARLVTHAVTAPAATRSIIAELAGSRPGKVVMLGAHLDSVIDGPGINDNGSGVAALLEIARALGGSRPGTTIRLAFWSGEELGLLGSVRYVTGLSAQDRAAILVYLNADMLASPNGFAGVYDEADAPAGSTAVRDLISAAIGRAGGVPLMLDLGGSSDHLLFGRFGIPTGGVFSGAREPVTEAQAVAPGMTAGLPADPCYHRSCDDGSHLNLELGRLLAAALADVAVQLSNDPAWPPG